MPGNTRKAGDYILTEDRFMTLREVAEYLHLKERTIYKWAQEGTIPASKLGSIWRFRRSEVDAWVEGRKNVRTNQPDEPGEVNES